MNIWFKIFYILTFCCFLGNLWCWGYSLVKEYKEYLIEKNEIKKSKLIDLIRGSIICIILFIAYIIVVVHNLNI